MRRKRAGGVGGVRGHGPPRTARSQTPGLHRLPRWTPDRRRRPQLGAWQVPRWGGTRPRRRRGAHQTPHSQKQTHTSLFLVWGKEEHRPCHNPGLARTARSLPQCGWARGSRAVPHLRVPLARGTHQIFPRQRPPAPPPLSQAPPPPIHCELYSTWLRADGSRSQAPPNPLGQPSYHQSACQATTSTLRWVGEDPPGTCHDGPLAGDRHSPPGQKKKRKRKKKRSDHHPARRGAPVGSPPAGAPQSSGYGGASPGPLPPPTFPVVASSRRRSL